MHLFLDNLDVGLRGLPGERLETGHVPPHTIKDPPLELEEIGVDDLKTSHCEDARHWMSIYADFLESSGGSLIV